MDGFEITRARRQVGVDQRQLALFLDLSPQRLSDMERGHIPAPDEFQTLLPNALRRILRERLAAVEGTIGEPS